MTYTFNSDNGPVVIQNIYSVALVDDDAMSDDENESQNQPPAEFYERVEHVAVQSVRVQILTDQGSNYLIEANGEIREWSNSDHTFVLIEDARIELSDDQKYMRVIEM